MKKFQLFLQKWTPRTPFILCSLIGVKKGLKTSKKIFQPGFYNDYFIKGKNLNYLRNGCPKAGFIYKYNLAQKCRENPWVKMQCIISELQKSYIPVLHQKLIQVAFLQKMYNHGLYIIK